MELIVFVCNSGYAYKVMETAKAFGATGGTILHARSHKTKDKKVFGVKIHPEKDVLLIVCLSSVKEIIMNNFSKKHGIKSEANGIVFSLNVSGAYGIKTNIRDVGNVVV